MPPDPQFEPMLAQFRAMPPLSRVPIALVRAAPVPAHPSPTPVDAVSERSFAGPASEIKLRVYRKGTGDALPLLVFFHGGGFVVGGLDTHDEMARVLTAETGCVTVSVDYRLAPEHPFPAAPDDCFAALTWSAAEARALGADPRRIIVAGDSAGGNLAAVAALRARDEGGPALKGQVLIYPVTDLPRPFSPAPDGEYHVISPQERAYFNRCYLSDPAHAAHPYASPMFADSLKDLPPALVITAEYDPLRAQGEDYAAKLRGAGVETALTRYDGAPHGFASFPTPMGMQALRQAAGWMKLRFA